MAASDSKRLAYLMQGAALRHEQASLVKPLAKLKAKHSKAVNALESKAVLRIRDVVSADKMVSRKAVHAVRDAVRRDLASWDYEPPLPSAHDLLSTAAELMSQLTADADDACVDARERCAASAAAANSRLRETSDRRSLLLSEAAEAACGVAPARGAHGRARGAGTRRDCRGRAPLRRGRRARSCSYAGPDGGDGGSVRG